MSKFCAELPPSRLWWLGPAAAREHVRVARALAGLPQVGAALARGDISFSKVRAITRVATPEREETLLRLARFATAQQLERICRGVRQVERNGNGDDGPTKLSAPDRFVVSRNLPDGTVEVVARLQPDEARAVMEAIDQYRKTRRLHHRLVHEDGFTLTLDDKGRPLFRTPRGRPILPKASAPTSSTTSVAAPTSPSTCRSAFPNGRATGRTTTGALLRS